MTNYGICCYTATQFFGYLIQILPLMVLFYVPYSQELLRFSKRRILIFLSGFFVIMSAVSAVFLAAQVWQNVNTAEVRWIANLLFLVDIVVGTVVYFISFRERTGGKLFFYTVVLEYGIALYILNEIGDRFISISGKIGEPYSDTGIMLYVVCTAVTYPFIYRFLKNFSLGNMGNVNHKNLCMITICSVIIVFLTMVALQVKIGLSSLHNSMEENIYESILLGCILLSNVISYVIYFFCMILEQERGKMESKVSAYEIQYENVREGIAENGGCIII